MDRLVSAAALPMPLREDLRLHASSPEADGAPTWSIQDPLSNRFYRIGWFEFECLLRLPGDAAAIADDISRTTPLAADQDMVEGFVRFLEQHHLLRPGNEALRGFARDARQLSWRNWQWWLHHYLFIRVPLVKPDRFLSRCLPWVRPLVSLPALLVILFSGVLGLLLVARQWDEFTHALSDSFSPAGIAAFALALIVSKLCHELGHALVATRYGVRVAHMGVALVVLWPMLYTDTSESWRLRLSRQRLAVSSAGIVVEMALAGLATLAWALAPDGVFRQAMLYLATTGWLLTLALNASPFMRFDGYFILSDLLDFPNLHERAGLLARAWLRQVLFGAMTPDQENLSSGQRRALIAFALLTWLYRFTLFLGIAVAVYLFFFKALGLFLFAVEIAWFVVMPVWKEITTWRQLWPAVNRSRRHRLGLIVGVVFLLLAFPWSFDVKAPAFAISEHRQQVFAPMPATLNSLRVAGRVAKGEVLAQFSVPELAHRERRAVSSIQALNQRLVGQLADDATLVERQATGARLSEQMAEQRATVDEQLRLRVVAEQDGIWQDLDPAMMPGAWLGVREPVGVVIDPERWVVDAYVEEAEIERLQAGASARFLIHGQVLGLPARVLDIDTTRATRLAHPMLDSRYGGPILTQTNEKASLPVKALYRIRLSLDEPVSPAREVRGIVIIEGRRHSLLFGWLRELAALLIRESGF